MFDYIEHLNNPRKILEKSIELLENNGILVITTPKTNSLSHHLMHKNWPHYKSEHLYYFSSYNLKKLLQIIGFNNIQEFSASKYLSFQYICNHFRKYTHPIITPILNFIDNLLPKWIKNKLLKLTIGEMLIIAKN